MKTLLSRILLTFVLLIGLGIGGSGCSRSDFVRNEPHVIMELGDPSLEQFSVMWQKEIERRFDNAVGILVHGGDFVEGQWIAGMSFTPGHVTPMREVVQYYQKKWPGRTIVLLACNTGHVELGIPGVYYAKNSVWCIPDRAITTSAFMQGDIRRVLGKALPVRAGRITLSESRWQAEPEIVGNIFEMVCE